MLRSKGTGVGDGEGVSSSIGAGEDVGDGQGAALVREQLAGLSISGGIVELHPASKATHKIAEPKIENRFSLMLFLCSVKKVVKSSHFIVQCLDFVMDIPTDSDIIITNP